MGGGSSVGDAVTLCGIECLHVCRVVFCQRQEGELRGEIGVRVRDESSFGRLSSAVAALAPTWPTTDLLFQNARSFVFFSPNLSGLCTARKLECIARGHCLHDHQ